MRAYDAGLFCLGTLGVAFNACSFNTLSVLSELKDANCCFSMSSRPLFWTSAMTAKPESVGLPERPRSQFHRQDTGSRREFFPTSSSNLRGFAIASARPPLL
jgi:hypothetical protein